MTKEETMLMSALSAIVHYQEYIDTGESLDLFAAHAALSNEDLRTWVDENDVLLPVRRDGQKIRLGDRIKIHHGTVVK